MLVNGIVKDGVILFEGMLGSVAVMDVEIDNAHPFDLPLHLKVARGDGHVVEVAKAHGLPLFGMVAGRAHSAKGVVDLPGHEHAGGLDHPARGQQCGLIGVDAHLVVRVIERAVAGEADLFKPADVGLVMDGLDPFHIGPLAADAHQVRQQAGLLDAPEDHFQAFSHLRMVRAGVVQQKSRVIEKTSLFHCRPHVAFNSRPTPAACSVSLQTKGRSCARRAQVRIRSKIA